MDKLTLAALEGTVALYLRGDPKAVPALRMIYLSKDEISGRASRLAERLAARPEISAELRDGQSVMGGGSTPGQSLPTRLVAVTHARRSAQELEALLRRNRPPIIARVERGWLLLDLRTVLEEQDEEIAGAFERLENTEAQDKLP